MPNVTAKFVEREAVSLQYIPINRSLAFMEHKYNVLPQRLLDPVFWLLC